jgi:TRAP-type mannitol/chloroaromatic compound transport system permease small subunit
VLALEAFATRWTRWLALAGGWVLLGVAVLTVADALLRKLLSRPLPGVFESSELLLAAVIFFAMPYTGLTDGHVSVDLLTGRLSARTQSVIIGINALVCAVILGFIAYQMASLVAEFWRTSRTTITMRIPIVPFIVPVTAAAGLAALGFVVQGLGAFARAGSGPGAGPTGAR